MEIIIKASDKSGEIEKSLTDVVYKYYRLKNKAEQFNDIHSRMVLTNTEKNMQRQIEMLENTISNALRYVEKKPISTNEL